MEDQETTPPAPDSEKKKETRIESAPEDTFDPNQPRLGRRESEPHSWEVTYLHDVLETNFPESRTMWDLHHYFAEEGEQYDIRFDISFFPNFKLPVQIPSYRAAEHGNRIPALAINILSKATFRSDVGETVDICKAIKIPIYVVFSSHPIGSNLYRPPFVRAYVLQESGKYDIQEIRKIAFREGDPISNLDNTAFIDLNPDLAFKIGIMEKQAKYIHNDSLYRLILIDKISQKLLLTQQEKEKQRADAEKQRADAEKQRADAEKQRADEMEHKLKSLTESKTKSKAK